jgi:hypothetical protein
MEERRRKETGKKDKNMVIPRSLRVSHLGGCGWMDGWMVSSKGL